MSFTIIEPAPARLNRSELAVPGSRPELFEKAAKSAVDVLFLDLEDAVAPDDKERARRNIVQALNEIDFGKKTVSVRINGLDTHYMYRDVVDVIEQGGDRLDLIMIPKVGTAADVYAVDMLVTQCEMASKRKKRIGFELIIETALGMSNVDAIAAASKRNESLHFGVADYAASTRARTTNIGGPNPLYSVLTDKDESGARAVHWGDMWHYAIARMMRLLDAAGRVDESALTYPPYNIEKTGEDSYRVTMAVAGFSQDELNITVQEGVLTVTGKAVKEEEPKQFLHRGIARRAFERRFELADHIQVRGANLTNGLLHIDLVREVPEAMKPRSIKIGSSKVEPKVIDSKAA